MRTEWVVTSSTGQASHHRSLDPCDQVPGPWDDAYPGGAPHTVVERQVAGPEDTDELLRLRERDARCTALVDELREMRRLSITRPMWSAPALAKGLLDRHGFGGES